MLRNLKKKFSPRAINSGVSMLVTTLAFLALALCASAQAQSLRQTADNPQPSDPIFRDYKGVSLGLSADDVHRKLGAPTDASTLQDFYAFSEKESVQIFYDNALKVKAVSVNYLGEGDSVPDCKTVLGLEIKAEADGAVRKIVQYRKAGYQVSYNRTGGADPLITITMQKISQPLGNE